MGTKVSDHRGRAEKSTVKLYLWENVEFSPTPAPGLVEVHTLITGGAAYAMIFALLLWWADHPWLTTCYRVFHVIIQSLIVRV